MKLSEKNNDIFRENGIILCSDYFYVVVFQIEQNGELDTDILFFILTNIFGELYNNGEDKGYLIALQQNRYAILVNKKNTDDEKGFLKLLYQGKNFLEQHYAVTATWGFSSRQQGLRGIHVAYEEACLALRYRYLLGKESMIDYLQTAGREFKYPNISEMRMSYLVSDYLAGKAGIVTSAGLVDEIMETYGIDNKASMETVDCFRFEVVGVLYRVMLQGKYSTEERKRNVAELLNKTTMEEFRGTFTEILNRIYQKSQEVKEDVDICSRVMEHIVNHYREEQLSLSTLGEMVGLAPSYLSKLFKNKYQVSVPDYISCIRISHAKEFLKNTDYNIQEIAERTGFVNSNSFIRTFKRQEGITPGGYRSFFEDSSSSKKVESDMGNKEDLGNCCE